MSTELITRLVKAMGPDREIDAMIWAEVSGRDVSEDGLYIVAKSRSDPLDIAVLGCIDPGKVARNFSMHWDLAKTPDYTGSIDAAVALAEAALPDMNFWGVESYKGNIEAFVQRNGVNEGHWDKFAEHRKSVPIALCIAVLKRLLAARAALAQEGK